MEISNYWWSSGAQTGGDPGDPIGQSLRFRGGGTAPTSNTYLSRALTANNTFTLSVWLKLDVNEQYSAYMGNYSGGCRLFLSGSNNIYYTLDVYLSNTQTVAYNNIFLRDPSAWYHLVINSSSADARSRCWINGQEVTTGTPGAGSLWTGATCYIGNGGPGVGGWTFRGYAAEQYYIDGQALDPTTFGRFNANGVWVPVAPSGLAYGTNGFHLTFADPSDVGKDYSGNGNDFTATGFDTNSLVSGYWVDAVYTATSGEVPNSQGTVYITDVQPTDASLDYTNSGTIQKAFDGDLSTSYVYWTGDEYGTGNVMSMTFDLRDYTDIESVELLTSSGAPNTDHSYTLELLDASKVTIAGTQVQTSDAPFASPEWVSAPVSGTPRYFRLWTTPVSGSVYKRLYLYAIRINGQILSQSATTAPTYDLMQDSPTQNYATLNPVLEPSNQTLSNANLTGGGGSTTTSLATQLPSYKYYWEATGSNYYYGISEIDAVRDNYLGSKANQVGWFGDGSFWVNKVNVGTFGPRFFTSDVAMQAYDPATGNYWVGVNGTWHESGDPENGTNPAYTVSADFRERMLPASNLSTGTNSFNFGQQPFLYTPPADFSALQTANMPAASITNGRDHFQAITGPGEGALSSAITAVDDGPNVISTSYTVANSYTHTVSNPSEVTSVVIDAAGSSGGGGYGNTLNCRFETNGGDDSYYADCTSSGRDGGPSKFYRFSYTPAEYGGSSTIEVGAGSGYSVKSAATTITPDGTGLVGNSGSGDNGDSYTIPRCDPDYRSCLTPVLAASGSAGFTPSNYVAELPDSGSWQYIAGGAGGSGTSGTPGSTGQATVYEYYPTGSGIGTPSGLTVLTFTDASSFADYAIGQTCVNQDSTATGTIESINSNTNQITLDNVTGTWSTSDTLRTTSGSGSGILGAAQQLFPSSLWWIKDRVNTNQHQLVDVMNGTSDVWQSPAGTGGHTYAAPSGDSVAWCWKAGDSDVANFDGTAATTVRANPDAGFSIVQWNGPLTQNDTAGHGLTQSPDFVIYLGYTGGLIGAWHSAPSPAAGYFYLNSTIAWTTNLDIVNSAGMTDTTIGIGTFSQAAKYTAYVWHSVPGYSAFGSYTGNGGTDGPFIYTGFKPAFVLFKSSSAAYNWHISSNAAFPYNPVNANLRANTTAGESSNSGDDVDYLSNGFKLKGNRTAINGSGVSVIYGAFAENPFQSPVTAR